MAPIRRLAGALALVSIAACVPPAGDDEVRRATAAWLATVPADARASSDAYFEGGYFLWVIGFAWHTAVWMAMLRSGVSAALRDRVARFTARPWLRTWIYFVGFLGLTALATAPWVVWRDHVREHAYGLSNQTLSQWAIDHLKGLALVAVLGGLAAVVVYAAIRRAGRRWWMWGAGVSVGFAVVGATVAPVYIAPMFNRYEPLEDGPVKHAVLRMAHANGIVANDVWKSDASRQSKRISANVSGMLGTERITLNDNLLSRCTPAEIEAVMGHEIGHYVLNHAYEGIAFSGALLIAGFAFVAGGYARMQRRWGERWRIGGPDDPAGMPLVAVLLTTWFFALEPVTNSYTRAIEQEADSFGLNAARQPDAFASVALRLAEYRKLDPGVLEEIVFFDHPSGRVRVETAMRWKQAHAQRPRE
jgi:STE24 endopeptidase